MHIWMVLVCISLTDMATWDCTCLLGYNRYGRRKRGSGRGRHWCGKWNLIRQLHTNCALPRSSELAPVPTSDSAKHSGTLTCRGILFIDDQSISVFICFVFIITKNTLSPNNVTRHLKYDTTYSVACLGY